MLNSDQQFIKEMFFNFSVYQEINKPLEILMEQTEFDKTQMIVILLQEGTLCKLFCSSFATIIQLYQKSA